MAIIMALLAAACTGQGGAGLRVDPSDGRIKLKQWGLAYCIAEYVEGAKPRAGAAMGGYFQLGSHGSEEAYREVRRFFDQWVAANPVVSKTPGNDLSLMNCIDAYESPGYKRVLQEQDRFLPIAAVPATGRADWRMPAGRVR